MPARGARRRAPANSFVKHYDFSISDVRMARGNMPLEMQKALQFLVIGQIPAREARRRESAKSFISQYVFSISDVRIARGNVVLMISKTI